MSDALLERIAVAVETIAKVAQAGGAGKAPAAAVAAAESKPKETKEPKESKETKAPKETKEKPAAAAAKPKSKHTQDEVRAIIRKVAGADGLGKKVALDLLDEVANVTNVSNLKEEDFDKVYAACQAKLGESDESGEDDPTA